MFILGGRPRDERRDTGFDRVPRNLFRLLVRDRGSQLLGGGRCGRIQRRSQVFICEDALADPPLVFLRNGRIKPALLKSF